MNLEERSFENLVRFYEPELRRIMRGEKPSSFMTTCNSRQLKAHGVLITRAHVVSEKAKQVLRACAEVDKNEP